MTVVAHLECRIPGPAVASKASCCLLASRAIITGGALTPVEEDCSKYDYLITGFEGRLNEELTNQVIDDGTYERPNRLSMQRPPL